MKVNYVGPESYFLPLAVHSGIQPSSQADVLACSYPTSQHDPGVIILT